MKYKVGDIVKVIDHLEGTCKHPDCCSMVPEMAELMGKNLTVSQVSPSEKMFRLKEDKGRWSWSECMVEKAKQKDRYMIGKGADHEV